MRMRTSLTRLRVNPVIDCSIHSNKILVSVNADFFDQLNYCRFLNTKVSVDLTIIKLFFFWGRVETFQRP